MFNAATIWWSDGLSAPPGYKRPTAHGNTPPGLDPRLGTALREGFAEAMRDPQLIAEGAKMDLELGFVSGVDVQALVDRLYKSPPEVTARAQAIVATN